MPLSYELAIMTIERYSNLAFHIRSAWIGAHMRLALYQAAVPGMPIWLAPRPTPFMLPSKQQPATARLGSSTPAVSTGCGFGVALCGKADDTAQAESPTAAQLPQSTSFEGSSGAADVRGVNQPMGVSPVSHISPMHQPHGSGASSINLQHQLLRFFGFRTSVRFSHGSIALSSVPIFPGEGDAHSTCTSQSAQ